MYCILCLFLLFSLYKPLIRPGEELPPASDLDFNLKHTQTLTHTLIHTLIHTLRLPCGERRDWEKIDLPTCGILRGLKPLRLYLHCPTLKRPPPPPQFLFLAVEWWCAVHVVYLKTERSFYWWWEKNATQRSSPNICQETVSLVFVVLLCVKGWGWTLEWLN